MLPVTQMEKLAWHQGRIQGASHPPLLLSCTLLWLKGLGQQLLLKRQS